MDTEIRKENGDFDDGTIIALVIKGVAVILFVRYTLRFAESPLAAAWQLGGTTVGILLLRVRKYAPGIFGWLIVAAAIVILRYALPGDAIWELLVDGAVFTAFVACGLLYYAFFRFFIFPPL